MKEITLIYDFIKLDQLAVVKSTYRVQAIATTNNEETSDVQETLVDASEASATVA